MRSTLALAALACGQVWSIRSAEAVDCTGNICFVEQGDEGVIVLGSIRGGVAVIDYDGDGWQDLAIADVRGLPMRLFRNVPDSLRPGNRNFEDVTAGSGLDDDDGVLREGFGVIAGDYDNDGDSDLLMTGREPANDTHGLLYRNDGGVFTNVSEAAGVRLEGFEPNSVSFVDHDLDGDLDILMVAHDVTATNTLFFDNVGDDVFVVANDKLPPINHAGRNYTHTWIDYDGDGYPDCFIPMNGDTLVLGNVSDGNGGRRFVDSTVASGFIYTDPNPMGIAPGDFDNDGDFDLAISTALVGTYYEDVGNGVQEIFPFATAFAWGVTWLDADNDGRLDNFQAGSYPTRNLDRLFHNLGNGAFENVSLSLNGFVYASQHAVQIDFNNDGRSDLIVLNPGTPDQTISVYENMSMSANHWLMVRAVGDGVDVNRDAYGAVVRVTAGGRTQSRLLVSSSSTTSTEDARAKFGLADAATIDSIEITWPVTPGASERTTTYPGPFEADRIVTFSYPPQDCNRNGVPDDADVLNGTSHDCNSTSVPDECEPVEAGDFDADGAITLIDHTAFTECRSAPNQAPSQGNGACAELCLAAFDFDRDGDVDARDWAEMQVLFKID